MKGGLYTGEIGKEEVNILLNIVPLLIIFFYRAILYPIRDPQGITKK